MSIAIRWDIPDSRGTNTFRADPVPVPFSDLHLPPEIRALSEPQWAPSGLMGAFRIAVPEEAGKWHLRDVKRFRLNPDADPALALLRIPGQTPPKWPASH